MAPSRLDCPRDGNCLFHALARSLDDGSTAASLRSRIVAFLEDNADRIFGMSPDEAVAREGWSSFAAYCSEMKNDGTWAGLPELTAAAELMNIGILVEMLDDSLPTLREIRPRARCPTSARMLHLLYDGDHYDAVARSGLPTTPRERCQQVHTFGSKIPPGALRERACEQVHTCCSKIPPGAIAAPPPRPRLVATAHLTQDIARGHASLVPARLRPPPDLRYTSVSMWSAWNIGCMLATAILLYLSTV